MQKCRKEVATRRLLKSQSGASAVEFALVAPIFIALMLSIIEAGYFFFINSAVTEATAKAARLVRTGQAQAGIDPEDFFDEICDVVDSFGDCDQQLTVDVARFDSFTDLANDLTSIQCRDSSDPTIAGAQFGAANYGARRDIVRVRICYLHRPVNPALGLRLAKNADGFREMVAVSVFRNEPFEN
ncbi:MAG: TadE/TadG family type IV pilus assembly protein [Pseudomonadota bacterium]